MLQGRHERRSTLDLVESLHLAYAVLALHDLKILASLKRPCSAEILAEKHELDPRLLRGTLEYVAARTDLISKTRGRFTAAKNYGNGSRFLLDLYAGAYGTNAINLVRLMRKPSLAPRTVDRARYARAFQQAEARTHAWLAGIIRQMKFSSILDLGCGPATLLLDLARREPAFVGWGVETNPGLCKIARARIRAARAAKRIRIMEGDSTRLSEILAAETRGKIHAVTACQIANEMFGWGSPSISAWLRELRKTLPGRPLLVSDYYGRLGCKDGDPHRETLLHDYAQVISGQGVPPASAAQWQKIYAGAGCRLVHVLEDRITTRFVHVVML
jgi:SAM-dependent methyltransferase